MQNRKSDSLTQMLVDSRGVLYAAVAGRFRKIQGTEMPAESVNTDHETKEASVICLSSLRVSQQASKLLSKEIQ